MPEPAELQAVIDREIPLCVQMGVRVEGYDAGALTVSMPLDGNHNHQQTAFAGSLSALCTIAGWGSAYLLSRKLEGAGPVVIRRSQIKYHSPVDAARVVARCLAPSPEEREHFTQMLAEKGQTKIDLTVEIAGDPNDPANADRPAVAFKGSYVVLPAGEGVA